MRTIYIIPVDDDPADHLAAAAAAGAGEIAVGVPPALRRKLVAVALPTVYFEPDPPGAPEPPAAEPGPTLLERLAALEEVADLLLTAMLDEGAS